MPKKENADVKNFLNVIIVDSLPKIQHTHVTCYIKYVRYQINISNIHELSFQSNAKIGKMH